jgi:hypothetical protein
MQTRRFGRTNHASTVAIFGAAALWSATQAEADTMMEQVIAAGVNHIDVAPSYGLAEERIGPWMPRVREQFFLGCKTMERDAAGAAAEREGRQAAARDAYAAAAALDPEHGPAAAALARLDPVDPRVAHRFELYAEGIELANGFHELLDPAEQRALFDEDSAERRRRGLPDVAIDERLLDALAAGLPDCAGVALGFDRLVMLAAGAADIEDVLWMPVPAGRSA